MGLQVVLDVSEFQSAGQLDSILGNCPDEIVGVYIKATQDLDYRDYLCEVFTSVCKKHNTAFGYYDYMTNAQADEQERYFANFTATLDAPELIPMMDCEGAYTLYAAGALHWEQAFGAQALLYGSESEMPKYPPEQFAKRWVAAYPESLASGKLQFASQASPSAIASYTASGYLLWQFTDSYMGHNQDASILLGSFEALKL